MITRSASQRRPLGTFIHFEHVNLRVPDHRLATVFFVEGLGFTRDPLRMVGIRNMWVNVGQQQFHLPIGEAAPFAGEIGLTVPDPDLVVGRLKALAPVLEQTRFAVDDGCIPARITSPWGHQFRLHPQGELSGRLPQAIPYVRFSVPVGTANAITAFYRDLICAPAQLGECENKPAALVNVGVDQQFQFVEEAGFSVVEHPNHVALYLTDYDKTYQALEQRELLMAGDRAEQFRFAKIADNDTGRVLYSIEHEMRSLYHPDFRKPLVNRIDVPYRVD